MSIHPRDLAVADASPGELSMLRRLRGATCRPWGNTAQGGSNSPDVVIFPNTPHVLLPQIQLLAAQGVTVIMGSAERLSNEQLPAITGNCASRTWLLAKLRGSAYFDAARETLRSSKLGRVGLVRYHLWHDDDYRLEDCIDIVCALAGAIPGTVFANRATGHDDCSEQRAAPALVQVSVQLGFSGGAMAIVDWQRHARFRDQPYESLNILGSNGAFYADDHDNVQLLYGKALNAVPTTRRTDTLRTQIQAWLNDENRNGVTPPWSELCALRSLAEEAWARKIVATVDQCCQRGAAARLQATTELGYEF